MNNRVLVSLIAPAVGAAAAFAASFALVLTSTSAPDQNPAAEDVLVYGE